MWWFGTAIVSPCKKVSVMGVLCNMWYFTTFFFSYIAPNHRSHLFIPPTQGHALTDKCGKWVEKVWKNSWKIYKLPLLLNSIQWNCLCKHYNFLFCYYCCSVTNSTFGINFNKLKVRSINVRQMEEDYHDYIVRRDIIKGGQLNIHWTICQRGK